MIASPRLVLLAACLYAPPRSGALRQVFEDTAGVSESELELAEGESELERAEGEVGRAAYIPGAVHVPRATLPHAVSHRPAGHRHNYINRVGAQGFPSRWGGARVHMVAPQNGGSDSVPAFPKPGGEMRSPLVPFPHFSPHRDPSLTAPIPVKAEEVITQWEVAAAKARAEAAAGDDERTVYLMVETLKELGKMRRSIKKGTPKYAFAIVASDEVEDASAAGFADSIQAIATVSPQVFMNDFGMFAAAALEEEIVTLDDHDVSDIFEVEDITGIVGRPAPDREPGAAEELIHGIIEWAAAADRLVTIGPHNEELVAYYEGLGFKTVPSYDPYMVYSGKRLGGLPEKFKMITLAL